METAEVLRKALELLGPSGENWVQGGWGSDETKTYCSMGAIRVATHGRLDPFVEVPEPQMVAYHNGLGTIQRHVPTYGELWPEDEDGFFSELWPEDEDGFFSERLSISSYNDQPTTTFQDIQLMFKKAIFDAENDG